MSNDDLLKEIVTLVNGCNDKSATKCYETIAKIKEVIKEVGYGKSTQRRDSNT